MVLVPPVTLSLQIKPAAQLSTEALSQGHYALVSTPQRHYTAVTERPTRLATRDLGNEMSSLNISLQTDLLGQVVPVHPPPEN